MTEKSFLSDFNNEEKALFLFIYCYIFIKGKKNEKPRLEHIVELAAKNLKIDYGYLFDFLVCLETNHLIDHDERGVFWVNKNIRILEDFFYDCKQ